MDSESIFLLILIALVFIGLLIILNPGRRTRYEKHVTSNHNGTRRF
ncbi:MAG: hypothetical protein WAM60_25025 [Candidatus Promineifilaceae bacterium]